jgi:uncharacterized glyoxalase superfamily protein PhnB
MAKKRQTARKTGKKTARKAAKTVTKKRPTKRAITRAAATRATAKPAARKPAPDTGLRTIAPGFTVNDVHKSIAWYTDMLGFTVKERWEHEGTLRGAEMASGHVSIFLSQDDWKLGHDRVKGAGTRMYVTTGEIVDTLADRIKAHGGTLEHEPKDDWGMRTFAVTDPDGYKLTFMYTPGS